MKNRTMLLTQGWQRERMVDYCSQLPRAPTCSSTQPVVTTGVRHKLAGSTLNGAEPRAGINGLSRQEDTFAKKVLNYEGSKLFNRCLQEINENTPHHE